MKTVGTFVVPVISTAPSSPVQGQIYFDPDDDAFYGWDGSAWVALSGGGGGGGDPILPLVKSGEWQLAWGVNNLSGSVSFNQNVIAAAKIYLAPTDYDALGCNVATQGASSTVIRMGLYEVGSDGGLGALVIDAGTQSAVGTGLKTFSITPMALGGWYWIVAVHNSSSAVAYSTGDSRSAGFHSGQSSINTTSVGFHDGSFTYAALPDPGPSISPTTSTGQCLRFGAKRD